MVWLPGSGSALKPMRIHNTVKQTRDTFKKDCYAGCPAAPSLMGMNPVLSCLAGKSPSGTGTSCALPGTIQIIKVFSSYYLTFLFLGARGGLN